MFLLHGLMLRLSSGKKIWKKKKENWIRIYNTVLNTYCSFLSKKKKKKSIFPTIRRILQSPNFLLYFAYLFSLC